MTIIFNGTTYYLSYYLNFIKFSFSLIVFVILIQSLACCADYPARPEDAWIKKYSKATIILSIIGSALWFLWFE